MNVLDKVVINTEDLDNATEFYTHFGVEVPEELQKAIDNFKMNSTVENQNAVQLEMSKLMAGRVGIFAEELFDGICEESKEMVDGK